MSIILRLKLIIFILFLAPAAGIGFASGQALEAVIRVPADVDAPLSISVSASDQGFSSFEFRDSHAGVRGLRSRIADLRMYRADGRENSRIDEISGKVFSGNEISRLEYEIRPAQPADPSLGAHVSWRTDDSALLVLADLLPEVDGLGPGLRLRLELPDGWSQAGIADPGQDGWFEVRDFEKSAVLAGRDVRTASTDSGALGAEVHILGEWGFSDREAADMAIGIADGYAKMFGSVPYSRFQVILVPIPSGGTSDHWRAETRGNTVTILSSPLPYPNVARQRLHEQLRHELLHLWVPNGLNFQGDYSWFYEGFAIYLALKSGVLNADIGFSDYLSTVSQAFRGSRSGPQANSLLELSTPEASLRTGEFHSAGIFAAFLCDLALMEKSGGKRDLREIFREVYRSGIGAKGARDGTESILGILRERRELVPVIDSFIIGSDRTVPEDLLEKAGLRIGEGAHRSIETVSDPNGRQKRFLDRLGYNSWRKLSKRQ